VNIIGAAIAGFVGTLAMIAFILVSPTSIGMLKIDISSYVGSIFTADTRSARLIGAAILCFDGIVLAIICAFLWNVGIGSATWLWGLIFGAVLGVLSLLVMLILMPIHPRPPEVEAGSNMMVGLFLWLGHLVYGLVTALLYSAF
jgi:hypothetical protein